jgi:hypothetical protein
MATYSGRFFMKVLVTAVLLLDLAAIAAAIAGVERLEFLVRFLAIVLRAVSVFVEKDQDSPSAPGK